MTQYREILRLHQQGISGRGIAASLFCSRNTVSEVLQAAKVFGIAWPLPDAISDRELEEKLFPSEDAESRRNMPDYDHIHKELSKSGVTLSLLWYEYSEECRQNHPIPYQYTQFCKYYNDYALKTKATMRIHHKPGGWHEKIGQETLADAILDQIVHDSYQIFIDGKVSMRERKGLNRDRITKSSERRSLRGVAVHIKSLSCITTDSYS